MQFRRVTYRSDNEIDGVEAFVDRRNVQIASNLKAWRQSGHAVKSLQRKSGRFPSRDSQSRARSPTRAWRQREPKEVYLSRSHVDRQWLLGTKLALEHVKKGKLKDGRFSRSRWG